MATSRTGTTSYLQWRRKVLARDKGAGITQCLLCGCTLDYITTRTPDSAEPDHITPPRPRRTKHRRQRQNHMPLQQSITRPSTRPHTTTQHHRLTHLPDGVPHHPTLHSSPLPHSETFTQSAIGSGSWGDQHRSPQVRGRTRAASHTPPGGHPHHPMSFRSGRIGPICLRLFSVAV